VGEPKPTEDWRNTGNAEQHESRERRAERTVSAFPVSDRDVDNGSPSSVPQRQIRNGEWRRAVDKVS